MKSVDVSAGTIEYREEGDPSGPPVVLLHGLLMNDGQWNLALPMLPPGFRYLLPVLPMGGLDDVTLVVTDWGGALFLTDAGRDKRVARLVICPSEAFDNFPPGFPGKVAWLASRNTLTVLLAMRQLKIGWLRRQWPMFGQMAKKPVPQGIVDKWMAPGLADRRIRQDLVKYCRTKFDGADLIRATNRLADFTGPALVLWSRNPVMPAEHGDRLAALLPKGQLRLVDDAYVLVMLDQPEHTAREIGAFLNS